MRMDKRGDWMTDRMSAADPYKRVWIFGIFKVVLFFIVLALVFVADRYFGDFYGSTVINVLLLILGLMFTFQRGDIVRRLIGIVALFFGLVGFLPLIGPFIELIPLVGNLTSSAFVERLGPESLYRFAFLAILLFYFFFRGRPRYPPGY